MNYVKKFNDESYSSQKFSMLDIPQLKIHIELTNTLSGIKKQPFQLEKTLVEFRKSEVENVINQFSFLETAMVLEFASI
jgi:hypothetical protein